MNEYDVSKAFQEIEDLLIKSMTRNLSKHVKDQDVEGFDWTMWQAEQLRSFRQFREENKKEFGGYFSTINQDIEETLKKANSTGRLQEEQKILKALKSGYKAPLTSGQGIEGAFLKINDRKLKTLIRSTTDDMKVAETAVLRMTNDKYRKIIFNAQVYANTGAGTVWQAVDMATKDFLAAGINCVEYKNGARVNIASYAEMAIRTANKRAFLVGEGSKRDEWGVHTVLVSQYGACSPTCLPWQGKVYIDDVFSGGKSDGKYPLLSTAISGGLFHPNCRHTTNTFFEGINTVPKPKDAAKTTENSVLEQKQRYNERQIRKYKRLEQGSLDQENIDKYKEKRIYWQQRNNDLIKAHPKILRRDYERENTRGILSKSPEYKNRPSVIFPEPTPLGKSETELSFKEKITSVKEKVLKNGNVIEESHLKEAGKALVFEISSNQKLADAGNAIARLKDEKEDAYKRCMEHYDKRYKDPEHYNDLYNDWKNKKEAYENLREETTIGNFSFIKTKLSEIREVGYGKMDIASHLNKSRSPMRKVIEEAYDLYPTDWVKKSIDKSALTPKKVDRGYYSGYEKVIAISESSDKGAIATAIHELGHRFEESVPEILGLEKTFYNRRTKGESPMWLGYGYGKNEKTRVDKFLNKYMGKDYGGHAYELVSMGFEMAYTEPIVLLADEDMAEWIFGMLAIL